MEENKDTKIEMEHVVTEHEGYVARLLKKIHTKDVNKLHDDSLKFGDRVADKIADVAGSWKFIIVFISLIIVWMIFNTIQIFNHYDTYPFILLNLVLSCIAAIQAPIIMMSQNRQEAKDRIRSTQDYETNMKAEILIEEILEQIKRIDDIEIKQNEILDELRKDQR